MGYWNDCRYAGADRAERRDFDQDRMVLYFETEDEELVEIPACYEVCPTCRGKGSHVNPSIDDCGLSREEFDEDPQFARDYFSGRYDQRCNECGGKRVVPVPDEKRCPKERLEEYLEHEREQAQADADDRRARALGY
ncbi:MAG: hypothetical protein ACYTG0_12570 [Planctomycetota bacterium]|jgi:hypothetical protein